MEIKSLQLKRNRFHLDLLSFYEQHLLNDFQNLILILLIVRYLFFSVNMGHTVDIVAKLEVQFDLYGCKTIFNQIY